MAVTRQQAPRRRGRGVVPPGGPGRLDGESEQGAQGLTPAFGAIHPISPSIDGVISYLASVAMSEWPARRARGRASQEGGVSHGERGESWRLAVPAPARVGGGNPTTIDAAILRPGCIGGRSDKIEQTTGPPGRGRGSA